MGRGFDNEWASLKTGSITSSSYHPGGSLGEGRRFNPEGYRSIIDQIHLHHRLEHPGLHAYPGCPELADELVVNLPCPGDRRGPGEIGPSPFFAFAVQGELAHQKGLTFGFGAIRQIFERMVQLPRFIIEDPEVFDFLNHPCNLGIAIVWADPDKNNQATANFSGDPAIDTDLGPGNPLEKNTHGRWVRSGSGFEVGFPNGIKEVDSQGGGLQPNNPVGDPPGNAIGVARPQFPHLVTDLESGFSPDHDATLFVGVAVKFHNSPILKFHFGDVDVFARGGESPDPGEKRQLMKVVPFGKKAAH